ncbi:MAG: GTPase Era [Gammaproteobacteria bacterium]|nr:GTPase Era [Gammaproteobacteria bacterium]
MTNSEKFQCGYVAIIGRPNVGKSTLLNKIIGQKICITSHKPQTTRHRILGIKTTENAQAVYVDTPGLHLNEEREMNRYMNRTASSTIHDVDVIIFVVERLVWNKEDQYVMEKVKRSGLPVILVINKIDLIADKSKLLPHIDKLSKKLDVVQVIPLSAKKEQGAALLEEKVLELLPQSHAFFPEEQLTDKSERFIAAEIIREKLMRQLNQELPYALTVEIEKFETVDQILRINGLIWVERKGQKKVIIGKEGEQLKTIGQQARVDMEQFFSKKVYLELWVKVREGWSNDARALRSLGYSDEM